MEEMEKRQDLLETLRAELDAVRRLAERMERQLDRAEAAAEEAALEQRWRADREY